MNAGDRKNLTDKLEATQDLPHGLLEPVDYIARGNAYFKLERYQEATQEYSAALDLEPDNDVALFNSGTVFNLLGRYGDAYRSFNRAQRVRPNDPDIIVGSAGGGSSPSKCSTKWT